MTGGEAAKAINDLTNRFTRVLAEVAETAEAFFDNGGIFVL